MLRDSLINWDAKLPALLMAYRSAEHEATTYTPARLMFGRELRLPVNLATGQPSDERVPLLTNSFAVALQERLSEVHRRVRGSLKMAGQGMKRRYDQGVRHANYSAGDKM